MIGDYGEGSDIILPDDLDDLFDLPYRLGARIRSDSWGASNYDYTVTSAEFDDV